MCSIYKPDWRPASLFLHLIILINIIYMYINKYIYNFFLIQYIFNLQLNISTNYINLIYNFN